MNLLPEGQAPQKSSLGGKGDCVRYFQAAPDGSHWSPRCYAACNRTITGADAETV